MKNHLKRFIIVLLIGTMLISIFFILKGKTEDKTQEDNFKNLAEKVTIENESIEDKENEEQEENKKQEQKKVTIDMQELYRENKDIVGWLQIEDTNVNYPVVQRKSDENYYLRRNFYKEYSLWGTPFLQNSCNINTSDNLIVYGHHIKGNKMFGELEKYKNNDFYNKHKKINLYTMEEKREYKVISVFVTTTDSDFKYYNYTDFKEKKEFETFIKKCQKLSFFDLDANVEYGDKFITLSTCDYSSKNGRLVAIARQGV